MMDKNTNRFPGFLILSTLLLSFLLGCTGNVCKEIPDISKINVEIEYDPLEGVVQNFSSPEEAIVFLQKNPTLATEFLHSHQYPSDTILGRRMYRLMNAPSIDSLFMATKDKFRDIEDLLAELEQAYKIIKFYYPHARVPKVQSIVSGFYNDLYISDSLIVVGLDYFLGKKSPYRPQNIPDYLAKRYEKETLVPIIMGFVANEFNNADLKHKDLLADMINLGKSYYMVSQLLPCTADSLIIGYSTKDITLVKRNQEIIWASLIENEMLYEKSHFLKNKFVGERPNVPEIGENCPGRIGAWLGWEIVKAYMEKNDNVTLTELMAEADAYKIFQLSKYRPKAED